MLLKSFLYKILNKVVSADISRVLVLDKCAFVRSEYDSGIVCKFLHKADLEQLATGGAFGITEGFVKDFEKYGFLSIAATINHEVIGIAFFGRGTVPARHNSGGPAFNGIAVEVPENSYYLFKAYVLPKYRGRRANSAMIIYALDSQEAFGLSSIITTTDWTNEAFTRSVRSLGFVHRGHACEIVLAGTHLFQIPKILNASR